MHHIHWLVNPEVVDQVGPRVVVWRDLLASGRQPYGTILVYKAKRSVLRDIYRNTYSSYTHLETKPEEARRSGSGKQLSANILGIHNKCGAQNPPSIQPDTPGLGVIRVPRQRTVAMLHAPEEQSVVGMSWSIYRNVASKLSRHGPGDVRQSVLHKKVCPTGVSDGPPLVRTCAGLTYILASRVRTASRVYRDSIVASSQTELPLQPQIRRTERSGSPACPFASFVNESDLIFVLLCSMTERAIQRLPRLNAAVVLFNSCDCA